MILDCDCSISIQTAEYGIAAPEIMTAEIYLRT